MSNEIKKQVMLSMSVLIIVLGSLFFWYDNFLFHTYVENVDYQACFQGQNDDFIVQGYELYQHNQNAYYGNERILSLKDGLLRKGDVLKTVFKSVTDEQTPIEYEQSYRVKADNEVCLFHQAGIDNQKLSQIQKASLDIQIHRQNKVITTQTIDLHRLDLTVYNGGNKNYMIQNVYASSKWLKTGTFSSTDHDFVKKYKKCVLDYLLLKKDGDENNIDDYERIINISQDVQDMLKHPQQMTYFYDGEGSLLERQLCCVVTLLKDEQDQDPLVFVIDLHGTIKEGIKHE